MARIRSIHPGLFTDEAFVMLSDAAQILLVGLWTEADDRGVFEWKPVTLRIRLRPGRDGAIEPLLEELIAANCVRRYEIGPRQLGAVRNFGKFQRPKYPKATHSTTAEVRNYVCSTLVIPGTDAVEPSGVPRNAEMSPQMEDGGGRGEEEELKTPAVGEDAERPRKSQRRASEYAFEGRHVRLTQRDYDAWAKAYTTIPDLKAELETIDAKFSDNPPANGKCFGAASAWLRSKHERLLAERQGLERQRQQVDPL